MLKKLLVFCAVFLTPQVAFGGPWDDVVKYGLGATGGSMLGPLAWCVITQAADDATPSVGVIGGCAADTGGNILETSSANTGPLAITDLDSPIVGMILYIVGTGGTDPTTIADGGNFTLEMDWRGEVDRVLALYVQADNDYIEVVSRHNGPRFFDDAVNIGGTLTCEADIATTSAADWDVLDNTDDTLCIDSPGGAGILCIDSRDGVEGVSMAGYLDVVGALTAGSLGLSGPLDMNDNDILNVNDIRPSAAMASDAPASPVTVHGSKHPYQEIGATEDDGANICWIPASGANNITNVTQAGVGEGATVTITSYDFDCAVTETVLVEDDTDLLLEFDCSSAATDAECTCLIYDAALRNATAGGYAIKRSDGTCSDAKLLIFPVVDTSPYVSVASSDADIALTRGVDGAVQISRGTHLCFDDDCDTYFVASSDGMFIYINGAVKWSQSAGVFTLRSNVNMNSHYGYDSTGAQDHGSTCDPTTMADTSGFDNFCGEVSFEDNIYVEGTSYMGPVTSSNNIRAGANFNISWVNGSEMYSTEDGDILFTDNATTGFDSLQFGKAMGTDADPPDSSVLFANSFAGATGTAQQGGDGWICTGIGTMQIVCDDYVDGALDEMVIDVVYGGGLTDKATLEEGTHWDAAVDDETTCNSIGAAVLTYYGAGGLIVADCTGGTCYLQPKHDLCDVDLSITNNAGDPFATLVEGDDGVMVLPEFVAFGGLTAGHPAWKRSGSNLIARVGDDTNVTSVQALHWLGSGYVRAASTSYFNHTGQSRNYSSADGYNNVTNDAENGYTRWCWGPETNQFACIYVDGAAGATFAGGAAITDAMALTLTGPWTIDDPTVGSSADSPAYVMTGNHWSNPSNYECVGQIYTDENGGDPYVSIQVDDACSAGAGALFEVFKATDTVISLKINNTGGSGYVEIMDLDGAGHFVAGDAAATAPSRISIMDGGADNEAGELVLYDDSGTGMYFWVNTADVFRAHNTAPTDDDGDGYAIMDLSDGTIGTTSQAGVFSDVTYAAYTRHHDFTAGALASVGVGAPDYACCGSFCGPGLDNANELLANAVEIPPEWDGVSDITIHIHAVPTDSDPVADTEDIDLDFEWRSVDPDTETGKTPPGAPATTTVTYLQSGGAGAECDVLLFSATVPYTGGNQPLAVGDDLGIKINRNPGAEANSYSGSLVIYKAELIYSATGKATH